MVATKFELKVIPYLRWTARIIGTLLVALVLLIAVGESISEGVPNFAGMNRKVQIMFLGLGLELVGLLLAWKWEGIGAGITILGYALFQVTEGNVFTPPLLPIFLMVAVIYGYCWVRGRRAGADTLESSVP